jgi:UTRA domain
MSWGKGEGAIQGGPARPPGPTRPSVQVLADRMAANLTHREPGYILPRRSALARRFQATTAEIDAAIEELVSRKLLRRLPTGELHRAGPAEYLVSLDGLAGVSSFVDPMDHVLSCTALRVSRLRAPADVAEALGLVPRAAVRVRRCLWSADGAPAASLATYVPEKYAEMLIGSAPGTEDDQGPPPAMEGGHRPPPALQPPPPLSTALTMPGMLTESAAPGRPGPELVPVAVRIEVQPPPRAVARRLRLASGAPALIVTARLDIAGPGEDAGPGGTAQVSVPGQRRGEPERAPMALTVLALRPELFRVVLDTGGPPAGAAAARARASGQLPEGTGNLDPRWQPAVQERGSAYRGAGAT